MFLKINNNLFTVFENNYEKPYKNVKFSKKWWKYFLKISNNVYTAFENYYKKPYKNDYYFLKNCMKIL